MEGRSLAPQAFPFKTSLAWGREDCTLTPKKRPGPQVRLPGGTYRVGRRLAGQYVVATLYPHRRQLVITLEHRVVKRFPCPIRDKVVAPLYPLPRGRW